MRVTLPSGTTAEFRDTFLRGDARNARKGMQFIINADGSRHTDGSFMDDITGRVISTMLIGWDNGQPLPSGAVTDELKQKILDGLDDDDYAALEKAVGPWVERVMRRETGPVFTHTATGIKVQPVNAADAEKLALVPEFTRDDEGEGPKPPASTPTAISS